jgi:anti-sigma B factor antagonist
MTLEPRLSGNVEVLALSGRFDARTAPAVQKRLAQAMAASPVHLVINLEHVEFIDSTALSTLVQAMKQARQTAGDVHLCGLHQPVRIIFELTRLDKVFEIYPSEAEAIEGFFSDFVQVRTR